MARLRTGDVFVIPLENGKVAVSQLVYYSKEIFFNPLIRVVKGLFEESEIDLEEIDLTDELFPPVCTGVRAAIRVGMWKKIGHKEVKNFVYPKFVNTSWDSKTGEATTWFLYDGEYHQVGPILPEGYKQLEFMVVWSPSAVAARILTGKYPFPYGDLIKYNRFTPAQKTDTVAEMD